MAIKTSDLRDLMYMSGCGCRFFLKSSLKNGLEEAKITLCASICWPSSHARVTSVNSLSPLRSAKEALMFSLKLFHWRQSFSELNMTESELWFDFVIYHALFILNCYILDIISSTQWWGWVRAAIIMIHCRPEHLSKIRVGWLHPRFYGSWSHS